MDKKLGCILDVNVKYTGSLAVKTLRREYNLFPCKEFICIMERPQVCYRAKLRYLKE
jgi:hypothetical protein